MKKRAFSIILLLVGATAVSQAVGNQRAASPSPDKLRAFFQKRDVTIAVTDSGLGGLSIMADAAARMKAAGVFRSARFVFYNALFSAQGGYNTLKTREEKAAKFDEILVKINREYKPDLILIACNTLSVCYDATAFSRKAGIPVIPIVPAGTDLIMTSLQEHPDAAVLIFGTPTTISEGAYLKNLVDSGIAAGRIFGQSCPELELYIERDYAGEETGMLISGFVEEALAGLPAPRPPFIASLNCTHYGYSLPLWETAFSEAGAKPLAILNPNSKMADVLFPKEYPKRYAKTGISAEVVSSVEILKPAIDSLAVWLKKISPEVAEALSHYHRR